MALYYLKFEELPDDQDRPPRHIWLDPDKMAEWWRAVKARREAEAKGDGAVNGMPQNEVLKDMFPGVNFG